MIGNEQYAAEELEAYREMVEIDRVRVDFCQAEQSWEHLEKQQADGRLLDYAFESFSGARHLDDMVRWIDGIPYRNFIEGRQFDELSAASVEADTRAFERLGLDPAARKLDAIGIYNAQDFVLQTPRPVPPRLRPRVVLDFGAGHGRQANLWLQKSHSLQTFIAMDAIAGPYLTQRMYFRALGHELSDYIDNPGKRLKLTRGKGIVHHLPSWRLDLIEDESVDLIIAVQVLRELTARFLVFALRHMVRVLRPGGMLYIRDHTGFHNVNGVDQARLLQSFGMMLEWHPMWRDGDDLHGIPRHWRKPDLSAVLSERQVKRVS